MTPLADLATRRPPFDHRATLEAGASPASVGRTRPRRPLRRRRGARGRDCRRRGDRGDPRRAAHGIRLRRGFASRHRAGGRPRPRSPRRAHGAAALSAPRGAPHLDAHRSPCERARRLGSPRRAPRGPRGPRAAGPPRHALPGDGLVAPRIRGRGVERPGAYRRCRSTAPGTRGAGRARRPSGAPRQPPRRRRTPGARARGVVLDPARRERSWSRWGSRWRSPFPPGTSRRAHSASPTFRRRPRPRRALASRSGSQPRGRRATFRSAPSRRRAT